MSIKAPGTGTGATPNVTLSRPRVPLEPEPVLSAKSKTCCVMSGAVDMKPKNPDWPLGATSVGVPRIFREML